MHLSPEDVEYLNANYPAMWKELREDGGKFGLLIKEFPIPDGYNVHKSGLMLLVPSGYPGSGLDMFYFSPELSKENGSIATLAAETHFDRIWQRWSRHYTWELGCDSIVTHTEYIKNQLAEELK